MLNINLIKFLNRALKFCPIRKLNNIFEELRTCVVVFLVEPHGILSNQNFKYSLKVEKSIRKMYNIIFSKKISVPLERVRSALPKTTGRVLYL